MYCYVLQSRNYFWFLRHLVEIFQHWLLFVCTTVQIKLCILTLCNILVWVICPDANFHFPFSIIIYLRKYLKKSTNSILRFWTYFLIVLFIFTKKLWKHEVLGFGILTSTFQKYFWAIFKWNIINVNSQAINPFDLTELLKIYIWSLHIWFSHFYMNFFHWTRMSDISTEVSWSQCKLLTYFCIFFVKKTIVFLFWLTLWFNDWTKSIN